MTMTNSDIFSDLNKNSSNPTASNSKYQSDVQSWLWNHVGECNKDCQILIQWVEKFSFEFSKYAKEIYPKSGYSARNILSGSKHKVWLDRPVEFPTILDCSCAGCNPGDDDEDEDNVVNICLSFITYFLKCSGISI